jgi:UDP-glucose 4-epimerase
MSILVTGGAGYIGSVVVDDLIANGETVAVIDDLSRGRRPSVNEKAAFYKGSIGDPNLIGQIIRENGITSVMHFSAYAYVGESVEKPDIYYQNNVIETVKLLDAMNRSEVKNLVFSSSCATFGEPQTTPINESHPQLPTNPYGRTKLIVEQVLRDYGLAYGLRSVALRYFNACGATETRGEHHDPETHLIPLALDAANGKIERLSVFGDDYPTPDGTAVRDYIHVSDLSDAHIRALKYLKDGGASDSFNLGNGKGFSVMEVIDAAKRVTGHDVPYKIEARRPGDPSQLVASSAKASEVLGWRPEYTELEYMIESAWRWRMSNSGSSATSG